MDLGIIGGADGPTAVLVGGDPAGLILVLLAVLGAAGAALWFFRHKRRKK